MTAPETNHDSLNRAIMDSPSPTSGDDTSDTENTPETVTTSERANIEDTYALSSTLQSGMEDVSMLLNRVSKVHAHLARLQTSNTTPYGTIAKLNLSLDEKERLLLSHEKQCMELTKKLQEASREQVKLRNEIEELKLKNNALRIENAISSGGARAMQENINKLQESVGKADKRIEGYRLTADRATSQVVRLEAEIRKMKAIASEAPASQIPVASQGETDWAGVPEAAEALKAAKHRGAILDQDVNAEQDLELGRKRRVRDNDVEYEQGRAGTKRHSGYGPSGQGKKDADGTRRRRAGFGNR